MFIFILFLFVCFYFHYSRRWVEKDLALIYIKECSACFPLRVSSITLRSLIYLEFISSNFILLKVVDQFSQRHLLKRLSFLHCIFLTPLPTIRCPSVGSVAQSCPTLCDPMNGSTPSLPVHHELPEFTQTHAHRVSDAIQPSHPLSSPSPNPSQHQSLFQGVNSSHKVAKGLEFQL